MPSTAVSLSACRRCADAICLFCRDKLVPQFRDLNRKASSSHSSVTRKRAMGNTTLGDAVLDISFLRHGISNSHQCLLGHGR